MQTVSIKTAQNIDIDYPVAGLGERIVGRIIDYAVYLVIIILYSWITSGTDRHAVIWNFTLPEVLFILFYAFYDLLTEIFFNGQSLGKYIMKIRVISLDGGRPTVGQYVLRYIFRAVDFVLTLQVGAIVAVATTENKQRIGDIVAGTTLIRTKSADNTLLPTVQYEETYQPVFEMVTMLSDHDIALINEVLMNFYKTGDTKLVENMGNKVILHLKIASPPTMNMYQFLKTILKDHHYITTQTGQSIV